MRNLILTAIASAALGCVAGYALAPDSERGTNPALATDGGAGLGPAEAGRGRGPATGMGHGGPGMGGGRDGHGHGGGPNAGPGGRGGRAGAFAGRGPGVRGLRGRGAGGPGRARRPPTGFDLAELERSLAHMSVELTLEDAQQQVIRNVMQEYRRRIREFREAILAELTTEQREMLRTVQAAGWPAARAEPAAGGNWPER